MKDKVHDTGKVNPSPGPVGGLKFPERDQGPNEYNSGPNRAQLQGPPPNTYMAPPGKPKEDLDKMFRDTLIMQLTIALCKEVDSPANLASRVIDITDNVMKRRG